MDRDPLPIDEALAGIVEAITGSGACIVRAPTGAGKTTRVPPALLEAVKGRIVMLEPRRVAVRAAARRMAAENGWKLGREVGYQIRFDRVCSDETRILVVTEGILTRMLQDDPLLEGTGAVILDEFHERSIHADLALAMTRHVRAEVRPDLWILVMSATIDPAPVAAYLGGCHVIESPGRGHPVEILHLDSPESRPLQEPLVKGVVFLLQRTDGDVLVFLPGVREIHKVQQRLARYARDRRVRLMPLFGGLPAEAQDAVLEPSKGRKVILSTNVAETSITIPGVTAVLDSGLARVPAYDPSAGLDRLEVGRISRASAEQRAGRAGRTAPGVCLRLWTRTETARMRAEEDPEILRIDLAGPVLDLLAWGEDPAAFSWLTPPPENAIRRALDLLALLGAVREGKITDLGRTMARLPAHPRLARLVVEGHRLGRPREACLTAALLSDPWGVREGPQVGSRSDVLDLVPTRRIEKAGDQLWRIASRCLGKPPSPPQDEEEPLLRAILAAYPDRIARRRSPGSDRGVMVGGRGVRITDRSSVLDAELFACVELDAGRRGERSEALVRRASEVLPEWLPASRIDSKIEHVIEDGRVRATERTLYAGLVIGERSVGVDPERASALLAGAATLDLGKALGLSAEPMRTFLLRVRFAARHVPDLDLPDLDEEHLRSLLPLLCTGKSSFDEIRGPALMEMIRGTLTHSQAQGLEQAAPERIQVPSGNRIRLDYGPEIPVLAVRIQELFGMTQTPSLARGRVAVMLHLLAPNMRPQQVTQDLESFWANTYPTVRKELRGRYPKHAWPEDPASATPSRPGRRRR
ncbi:MAG: ATP-dependent helicase HrpB [Deltaproteobacteria bacterium]|nr:ATP-dependent helicase HrpB [Deltaproteobacteria bacterium]